MLMRYPVLKTRKLRIDHLTTYSKYKPVTEYRDEQLKEPKPEVSHTDIQKACPPNLIHASDACQLAFTVDGYAGNFSLIHDAFGCTATAEMDVLLQLSRDAYVSCTTFDYLGGLLKANGVKSEDNPVVDYRTFDPKVSKDAAYMIC